MISSFIPMPSSIKLKIKTAGKQLHFNENFNLDALIDSALEEVENRYQTDNLLENADLETIILEKLPEDACYNRWAIRTEHALTLTCKRPRIIGQIEYGSARKENSREICCRCTEIALAVE